jgi:hypothetical protein
MPGPLTATLAPEPAAIATPGAADPRPGVEPDHLALRTLGRAWSRIIWRCWQTHTPYDPKQHTGLQQHIAVTIPTPSGPWPDLPATEQMAGTSLFPAPDLTPA